MKLIQGNIIDNPFLACTARDMDYKEVIKYWCDPFELYKINLSEFISSDTPIVLEGARGTGKTMLLKRLAYWGQKCRHEINEEGKDGKWGNYYDKRQLVEECGLGVYFRYKEDFCVFLADIDNKKTRERVFNAYFSLFILREIIEIVEDIVGNNYREERCICSCFEELLREKCDSFDCVNEKIQAILDSFDDILNDFWNGNEFEEIFMPYDGIFKKAIGELHSCVDTFKNVKFILLLDEYENAHEFQSCINKLIKQNDSDTPLTYRIGMRPNGMYDKKYSVGFELLQVDRDYLLRPLVLEKSSQRTYRHFIKEVCKKRLENYDELVRYGKT